MRIPYGFELISGGTLEVNKDEANIVSMIFDFYIGGSKLGKSGGYASFKTDIFSNRKVEMGPRYGRSPSF